MSQRGVERALGKLVTDEGFRERFFASPQSAALLIGVELSAEELRALGAISPMALADFARHLDNRIRRLHIPSQPAHEEPVA